MAYFGGLGAGKGWYRFSFVVEPEILSEALAATGAALVVTNGRVAADYESTPLAEYVEAYTRYLSAMMESPDAASLASSDVHIGLSASLDSFGQRPCPDARFKLMDTNDPVVTISRAMIHYDEYRGRLCTNVLSKIYFGAEVSYPRVISLAQDRHEVLYSTEELPGHAIYQAMTSSIRKATRPCLIRSLAREHRTSIRITDRMRESMQSHPGLAAARLRVV